MLIHANSMLIHALVVCFRQELHETANRRNSSSVLGGWMSLLLFKQVQHWFNANSTLIQANSTLIQANSTLIQANSTLIQANSTLIHTNLMLIHAKTMLIHSNSTSIHANSMLIHSNSTLIHAKTMLIHSNSTVDSCKFNVLICTNSHAMIIVGNLNRLERTCFLSWSFICFTSSRCLCISSLSLSSRSIPNIEPGTEIPVKINLKGMLSKFTHVLASCSLLFC